MSSVPHKPWEGTLGEGGSPRRRNMLVGRALAGEMGRIPRHKEKRESVPLGPFLG